MNKQQFFLSSFAIGFLLCLFLPFFGKAQISVDDSKSPEELVSDILIGEGIRVRDVRIKGKPGAFGAFTNPSGIPNFKEGILLSTGLARDAAGPNKSSKTGTAHNSPGDLILKRYNQGGSYDGAVLEFDFMAVRDSINLRFFFASEEYMDFVGTKYNDVMGIFVIGPGYRSGKDLAMVPGRNEPVHINTVNARTNKDWFVDNNHFNKVGMPVEKRLAELDPDIHNNIAYDGFTHVIEAGCKVIPRKTYHMRITITDIDDDMYDSAIFLDAKSFKSLEQARHEKRRMALRAKMQADSVATVRALEDSLRTVIADSIGPVLGDSAAGVIAAQLHFVDAEYYVIGTDTVNYDALPDLEKLVTDLRSGGNPSNDSSGENIGFTDDEHSKKIVKRDPFSSNPFTGEEDKKESPEPEVREWSSRYSSPPTETDLQEYKLVITFPRNEYLISDEDKATLREVAAFMVAHPGTRAGLHPFESKGDYQEESKTRNLRATLVEYFLVGEGVDPDRLFRNGFTFVGPGEAEEVSPYRIEIWMKKVR